MDYGRGRIIGGRIMSAVSIEIGKRHTFTSASSNGSMRILIEVEARTGLSVQINSELKGMAYSLDPSPAVAPLPIDIKLTAQMPPQVISQYLSRDIMLPRKEQLMLADSPMQIIKRESALSKQTGKSKSEQALDFLTRMQEDL